MSDVVVVSEGYITTESENEEIPENLKTVEEIVKFWSRKKVYKVRFKRSLPRWLEEDDQNENEATYKKSNLDVASGNCSKHTEKEDKKDPSKDKKNETQ